MSYLDINNTANGTQKLECQSKPNYFQLDIPVKQSFAKPPTLTYQAPEATPSMLCVEDFQHQLKSIPKPQISYEKPSQTPQNSTNQNSSFGNFLISAIGSATATAGTLYLSGKLTPKKLPPQINTEGVIQILSASVFALATLGAVGGGLYMLTKDSPETIRARLEANKNRNHY